MKWWMWAGWTLIAVLTVIAFRASNPSADAQLPQLTCCSSGSSSSGGIAQGSGTTITDNQAVRGDTSGVQGSALTISDVAAGAVTLAADDGATAQIDMTFNSKGAGSRFNWNINGVNKMDFTDIGGGQFALRNQSGQIRTPSGILDNNFVTWNNDSGVRRVAAGVIGATTTGSGTTGWMQWAGQCYVASDQTNATTTFASSTCAITVTTGRKYAFKCALFMSDSLAADGAKIDFAGGTATETNFRGQATAFDSALALSAHLDDLTDVASAATFTGGGNFEVHGSFEPSSTGTFIPRFAQAAHTTGTLTLYQGSHCMMWDMP